jgi:hypothetical protein
MFSQAHGLSHRQAHPDLGLVQDEVSHGHESYSVSALEGVNGSVEWFRWLMAPTAAEPTQLAHTVAQRVGRFLQRQDFWSGAGWR